MNPITCLFVGGPFDGSAFAIGPDDYLPDAWRLRSDPARGGETGLLACSHQPPCFPGERYVFSAFEGGDEAVYQYEALTTNVNTRELAGVA